MRSTFMGLEASKKGLFVQQSALYTTGHNISNANTEGYSRQRVNMQATPGYPHPGLNSPTYPGHLGTGVEASSVQRIRDEFIDRQYRQETNKLGYWESTLKSVNQMEDILAEPSEFGINQSFSDFWQSLETVSTNPEDSAARKVAISKAEALTDAFNYNATQLKTIQGNIGNEINVSMKDINSLLKQIAAINKQVQALEPNGYVTNDLYDARDVLVDQLNEYIPVSIERVPSGGNASEVAEGSLTITFKPYDSTTNTYGAPITLVKGKEYADLSANTANGVIDGDEDTPVAGTSEVFDLFQSLTISSLGDPPAAGNGGGTINYENLEPSKGKLLALIDAYGHTTPDKNGSRGIYPEMLASLDTLAKSFVTAFNEVHAKGYTLAKGTTGSALGGEFFNNSGTTASSMKVNQLIINDPNLLAASSATGEEGNGKWAIELANLQFAKISPTTIIGGSVNGNTDPITADLEGATFQGFYKGIIGDLAVVGQEATRLQYNSTTQRLTIENSRASMSSVSLDEEMTNMITFQQAYNANARMITVVDETLDKIINGMGRVGL